MKWITYNLSLIIYLSSFSGCKAQTTFGENYLQLTKIISLPGILEIGMKIYDALYSWAKYVPDEKPAYRTGRHTWKRVL